MPTDNTLQIEGEPVDVGSAGEHDVLFVEGKSVLDSGGSSVLLEEGTGVGGVDGDITFTVYDAAFNQLGSLGPVSDSTYRSGGLGISCNHSGVSGSYTGWWDYLTTGTSTTTVMESFEDTDPLSEWSDVGGADTFSVTTNQAFDGSHAAEADLSNGQSAQIASTSGLPAYPDPGDTITARTRWTDGTLADHFMKFGYQDSSNYYNVSVDAHASEDGNTEMMIEVVSSGSTTKLANSFPFEAEDYNDEWVIFEVVWN